MATEKLFTVVGVTIKKGVAHVRWCNDIPTRIKAFKRDEQTVIGLLQLDRPMTKYDAVQVLMVHEDYQDDVCQQAIDDYLYSAGVQAKAQKVKVEVTKVVEDDFEEEDIYAESMR